MDKSNKHLLESKSSIGTSATKLRNRRSEKKSKSIAEIKPLELKKRGVYVEKKPTDIILNKSPDTQPNKPKRIPRPGRKRFLTSVLNILSEKQSSTLHRESNHSNTASTAKSNNKSKKNKQCEYKEDFISTKRKPKFKRMLDDFQSEMDDFVANQCKTGFEPSPSVSTSSHNPESVNWSSFLPRLVPKTNSEIEYEKTLRGTNNSASKLMVANEPNRNDKNLYNFFVDLLETTFDVYNIHNKQDTTQLTKANSASNTLEIDMATDKKCNTDTATRDFEHSGHQYNRRLRNASPDSIWADDISDDENIPVINTKNRKVKIKSKSFVHKQKRPNLTSNSFINKKPANVHKQNSRNFMSNNVMHKNSANIYKQKSPNPVSNKFMYQSLSEHHKKTINQNPENNKTHNRKKNLLNLLKEQLWEDKDRITEPQNIYEALKLIAKNKKRCEKSLRFKDSTNKDKEVDAIQSMLRKHQFLSRIPNKRQNLIPLITHNSLRTHFPKPTKTRTFLPNQLNKVESRLSLRVIAYGYGSSETRNEVKVAQEDVLADDISDKISLCLSDASSSLENSTISFNDIIRPK